MLSRAVSLSALALQKVRCGIGGCFDAAPKIFVRYCNDCPPASSTCTFFFFFFQISLLSGHRTALARPELHPEFPNSRLKCTFDDEVCSSLFFSRPRLRICGFLLLPEAPYTRGTETANKAFSPSLSSPGPDCLSPSRHMLPVFACGLRTRCVCWHFPACSTLLLGSSSKRKEPVRLWRGDLGDFHVSV